MKKKMAKIEGIDEKCEFVGFSDKVGVPLFKLPNYESPQCINVNRIKSRIMVTAYDIQNFNVVEFRTGLKTAKKKYFVVKDHAHQKLNELIMG